MATANFRSTALQDLPETLTALKVLATLLIDNNEFKNLPSVVCNITTLAELSVTNNQLKSLSEDIGHLQRLQTVRLQGNPELTHLPLSFGRMRNLKFLEFDPATVVSPGGFIVCCNFTVDVMHARMLVV